jgi:magnesium transporter
MPKSAIPWLVQLIEAYQSERMGAVPPLLAEVAPYDIAAELEDAQPELLQFVLLGLPPDQAAEVLEHLDFLQQYTILDHLPASEAGNIINLMQSDVVADLLGAVHPKQGARLLRLLDPEYRQVVQRLTAYPENTAGGRMTIGYVSVRETMKVEDVLRHLRKVGHDAEMVTYIYVVDATGRLNGVISLRDLILTEPEAPVSALITRKVISVPAGMDQEEVARMVAQYDLVAIPVVDDGHRLLGIVTVDDIIDVLEEETTEDVYQIGGTAAPDEPFSLKLLPSVWALAKPRLPWLISLLFLELGSSLIVNRFSTSIAPQVAVLLALFTVVMAGESGNAATQALAVVVRGLATGELQNSDMPRIVLREALVGVLVGLLVGAILTITGWLWQGSLAFGLAIGIALAVNLFIAKLLGGLCPVVINRLGIDPAVASGPFITTLTDNTSMLVYYSLAALILDRYG